MPNPSLLGGLLVACAIVSAPARSEARTVSGVVYDPSLEAVGREPAIIEGGRAEDDSVHAAPPSASVPAPQVVESERPGPGAAMPDRSERAELRRRRSGIALLASGWTLLGLSYTAGALQGGVAAAFGASKGAMHVVPIVGSAIAGTLARRDMGSDYALAGWLTSIAQAGSLAMVIVGHKRLRTRRSLAVVPTRHGASAYWVGRF